GPHGRGSTKPDHLPVPGRGPVVEAEEVERAVGRQERDLAPERGLPALRLAPGLRGADHDVADIELAILVAPQLLYSLLTFRPSGGLTKREDVGGPVLVAVTKIQCAHLVVRDERDGDPRIGGKAVRLGRGADRAADRHQVARRIAAEGESQVPEALVGGVSAGGRRAMRSSGYGI